MVQITKHKLAALLKQQITISGIIAAARPLKRTGSKRTGLTAYVFRPDGGDPCRHMWIDMDIGYPIGKRLTISGVVFKYRSAKGRDNYSLRSIEVLA